MKLEERAKRLKSDIPAICFALTDMSLRRDTTLKGNQDAPYYAEMRIPMKKKQVGMPRLCIEWEHK